MSTDLSFTVNGTVRPLNTAEDRTLLDVLRTDYGLMATRFGCGEESCGSCMVLVDGKPVYACTRSTDSLAGRSVTTLEGLAVNGAPHPLQQSFLDEQAGQCGYCLSGILMSAKALLDRVPNPTRADITAALDPHLCRCGAHARIIRAVQRAAKVMATAGATP